MQTIIQTVTFVKHVTKHPVNGEIISETEWVVDGDSVWDEFTTPALDDYTPDITKLDAVTPDADTEDKHIYISYRENKVETSDKTINRVIKLILQRKFHRRLRSHTKRLSTHGLGRSFLKAGAKVNCHLMNRKFLKLTARNPQ